MQQLNKFNIDTLKRNLNYRSLYSTELSCNFKATGNGWYRANGLCPFHEDKKPGSLHVNFNTGAYKCFSCGEKGDYLDFIMKKYNLTFKDVIQQLGGKYNDR